VVDDDVGHDLGARGECGDVVPGAEPGIDLRVIDGVEAGVGAVNRMEERQHVHAAEQRGERPSQEVSQAAQRSAEPVGVRDQLYAILHVDGAAAGSGDARAAAP